MRSRSRHLLLGTAGVALALALGAVAQSNATAGTVAGQRARAVCPFSAAELSTIVGHKLQRVALGGGRVASQCAFSAVEGGKAVTPQIYLTLDPGTRPTSATASGTTSARGLSSPRTPRQRRVLISALRRSLSPSPTHT